MALKDLAAYVEKALNALSARIDDIRDTVAVRPRAACDERNTSVEYSKELQVVRSLIDGYGLELTNKYKELAGSLMKLGDEVWQLRSHDVRVGAEHPFAASPAWSDVQSKDGAYRSCVLVDLDGSPSVSADAPVSPPARMPERQVTAGDSQLTTIALEVEQIRSDLLTCQTEVRHLHLGIREDMRKLWGRVAQFEIQVSHASLRHIREPQDQPGACAVVPWVHRAPDQGLASKRLLPASPPGATTGKASVCSGASTPLGWLSPAM